VRRRRWGDSYNVAPEWQFNCHSNAMEQVANLLNLRQIGNLPPRFGSGRDGRAQAGETPALQDCEAGETPAPRLLQRVQGD